MMKKLLAMALLFAAFGMTQEKLPGIAVQGQQVLQDGASLNGGYIVFSPITYNPYDGSVCHDNWTNPVQQPMPGANMPAFGANDILLWNSASPSMPFTTGAGLVQS